MYENHEITNKTDFGAAFLAGVSLSVQQQKLGEHPFIFNPLTYTLTDLEHLLPAPLRVQTSRKFHTQDDFCEYVKRFKKADSSIYVVGVHGNGFNIVAEIDHQSPGAVVWKDHTATFGLERSEALTRWIENSKKRLSQAEFADLLEERAREIVEPPAAEILDIAQSLHVTRNLSVKSLARAAKGTNSISFNQTETLKSGEDGNIDLPRSFEIVVEPFSLNREKIKLTALLRPQIREDKPVFVYELQLVEETIEEALRVITGANRTQTGLNLYR